MALFHFVIDRALVGDYVAHIAAEALAGTQQKKQSPAELARESPGPATKFLRQNQEVLLQMVLVRGVENFETYVSEVLRDALRSRPELLRSSEQVRLDYVLRFSSMAEMMEDLVDRKVADLGYLGLAKISEWVQEYVPAVARPDGRP